MITERTMQRLELRLTGRQVNLLLEVVIVTALLSGLVSWIVPLSSARVPTLVHAVAALLILVVAPLKVRGPVRVGFRRRRRSRWLSVGLGGLVLATIVLGIAHSTGLWFGVGYWSALWTHQLFGLALTPMLLWHVVSRPVRPSTTDLDRRGVVTTGAAGAVALGVIGAQELAVRAFGLAGETRAGTGSHDTGSFDPAAMPTVQWFDDTIPAATDAETWRLRIADRAIPIEQLWASARPLTARLDCTGGWYANQNWDVVSIGELLPEGIRGRSVRIISRTGYGRLFPLAAIDELFLAVGYDGVPLRPGHGAPVRVVAPGRRGPQWVKWVTEVAVTDRPSWLQLPLPPT